MFGKDNNTQIARYLDLDAITMLCWYSKSTKSKQVRISDNRQASGLWAVWITDVSDCFIALKLPMLVQFLARLHE